MVRAVNAAIKVAALANGPRMRVLDMYATFTPTGGYRASMPIDGVEMVVRDSDGIHLNEIGARVALQQIVSRLQADFG